MRSALRTYFNSLSRPQQFLLACGLLLLASAAVHGVVYLADGGPWVGPLSWRKPILFGFSFGITAVTVALVASALRMNSRIAWLTLGSLGLASVLETALITMQTWRGVPSHFNFSTAFDTSVFITMGVVVGFVSGVIFVLTVLTFTSLRPLAPSLALAIRAGMMLLLAAQVLGILIITTGVGPASSGDVAAVFGPHGVLIGAAGVLKSPHGIAMHAIQLLPALALLAQLLHWTERRRLQASLAAATGYALIVAVSTGQAFSGQAQLELSPLTLAALLLGILLLAVPGLTILSGVLRNRRITITAN